MQMRFQARLEPVRISVPWTIIRLPFDPAEAWPERVKLRVRGTIRPAGTDLEPHAFATNLQRSGELGYLLLVTEKMRKAARLSSGSVAEILLEPDLEGRAAIPPSELAKLLRADRSVKKWFESLNYSMRKFIADNIREVKSAEIRVRRAEQWIERMMLTMEGEESPPPILQAAFRRQPLARAGWDKMTPNRRRMTLLGIFSCQGAEARAKRVEKAMTEALEKAGRNWKRGEVGLGEGDADF